MNRLDRIEHLFVEFIPEQLENGKLYVSVTYATASHLCCCGCGSKIVTPITPTDWRLTYDGETVTLDPSIGNWGLKCESHYWIEESRVVWARRWSRLEIETGRRADRRVKEKFFEKRTTVGPSGTPGVRGHASAFEAFRRLVKRLMSSSSA